MSESKELTFNAYQAATHKTAAYNLAEKEEQRRRAVALIGDDSILDLMEAFVAWAKIADGFKKFIRDGKVPKRSKPSLAFVPSPHPSKLMESYSTQDLYVILGFMSEVGELVEKLTLWFEGGVGSDFATFQEWVKAEMGDNFWYLSEMATLWKLRMGDVAQGNVDKLQDRQARNVIHGDGDNR